MNEEQIKRQILAIFYDERVEEVTPSFLTYRLAISPKEAEGVLDTMVLDGMLELDSDEGGNLFYCLPDGERERLKRIPPKPSTQAPPREPPYRAPNGPPSHVAFDDHWDDVPSKGRRKGRRPMPGRAKTPYGGSPQGHHGQLPPGYGPGPQDHYDPASRHAMMRAGGAQMTPYGLAPRPDHNPGLAVVLAVLFPGAGQIYNGQVGKGFAAFLGSTIGMVFIVGIFVWIWSLVDALNTAKKIQSGIPV